MTPFANCFTSSYTYVVHLRYIRGGLIYKIINAYELHRETKIGAVFFW